VPFIIVARQSFHVAEEGNSPKLELLLRHASGILGLCGPSLRKSPSRIGDRGGLAVAIDDVVVVRAGYCCR